MTDQKVDDLEEDKTFEPDSTRDNDGKGSEIKIYSAEGGNISKRKADKQTVAEEKEDDDEDEDENEDNDDELEEAFDAIFGDSDLSEEAKSKLSLIFKAAINEAVDIRLKSARAKLEESMREEVAQRLNDLSEENARYMDYVSETYLEENKIAIETGIKVELAESLIESLKSTLVEHSIVVDTDNLDLVEDLEKQIENVNESKNAIEARNLRLLEENRQLKAEKVFAEISEGLTDVEKDRLSVLAEKIAVSDINKYSSDLATLRESFFDKSSSKTRKTLIEEAEENMEDEKVDDEKEEDKDKEDEKLDESFAAKLARVMRA